MCCLRPATPGVVGTFGATILLAIVSFSVPYIKSFFFVKALINQGGVNGSIVFGTLGYCLELSNDTLCSTPSVGYQLDINSLVDKKLPIQIPAVVDKWMTTALLLHFAALIVAALSAFFGLLAHCCEMSMRCSSTYSSGFAAVIALFAFIFDLVLFFVAKARINSVGSATIGSAIWLTLAAWVLLFFSGWFYSCGKNGTSNPPSKNRGDVGFRYGNNNPKTKRSASDDGDEEFFRNVARVAAEDRRAAAEERRARQKTELGLPKMPEVQVERVPIEQQPTAVTDRQARTLLVQTLDGPIEGHDNY